MKKKRIIRDIFMVVAGILMLIAFIYLGAKDYNKEDDQYILTDAEKFAKEYPSFDKNNVFVYRTDEQIIKILKDGTGIVYLGFPECPWCQKYVSILNEVAKENNITKIYYFNILEDRKLETPEYKEMVSLLKNYLDTDDEGNKRIFVPEIVFVQNGEIIAHNNETAKIMNSTETPESYWTEEKITSLKTLLTEYITQINSNVCTDCNE